MWTCSRLLRSPSLDHPPPLLDGPASTPWVMLHLLHLYKYTQCEGMTGALSDGCVHQLDTMWETLLHVLLCWLLLEYKTEAHKLHRGIEWYFYITNRKLPAYTGKHCDFLYQDLSHSTFLRATHTAVRLAIIVPPSSLFCLWTCIFRREG